MTRSVSLFPRRLYFTAVLAAVLAVGFAPIPKPKPPRLPTEKQELKRLKGKWAQVLYSVNGSPLREVKGQSEVIEGERLACVSERGEVTARWTVVVRPSKSPKEMDLCTGKGEVVVRCIYKLEGDTLTFSYRNEAHTKDRPADFAPRKGCNVQVLRRAK